jgi:hypothetical protein
MKSYTGPERRAPDRKELTNQFTIKLMRQINMPGNVVLINEPVKFKGHQAYNYTE